MATSYKPQQVQQKAARLAELMREELTYQRRRRFYSFYPDTGPLRRELYVKHLAFFAAGAEYPERCAMFGNRTGKTEGTTGYEFVCHLTGIYPAWWCGHRFNHAIDAWAAGTTNQTVRDILQRKLLGPMNDIGTGLIPGDLIIDYKKRAGSVPDSIETIYVRHISGKVSMLGLKSYEQGRKAFEGTEKDVVLLDEEPPIDVYTECLTRTMATKPRRKRGHILLGFTPLDGLTETVLQFMPAGEVPKEQKGSRFVIQADWDDAPHLSAKDKIEILASYPPHQRDARSKGIPQLGSGAIYPIAEDDVFIDDFVLPDYWPRGYGMDVGWKMTAGLWGCHDRDNDTIYIYSEYKRGLEEPNIHVSSFKLRGDWMNGVIDPAARGRAQKDGERLIVAYQDLGLKLSIANNAVEAGIFEVWKRLVTGRLKIFKSCVGLKAEFRIYRRDDKGKVVKDNDHLLDCLRYLIMSGIPLFEIPPVEKVQSFSFESKEEQAFHGDPLRYGLRSGQ